MIGANQVSPIVRRYLALITVVALLVLPQRDLCAQPSGFIEAMLLKGRNALDDLRYRDADSIATRVLQLGNVVTIPQQVAALQLATAAAFPEEATAQRPDTAIARIRRLVALRATAGIPRELSWSGLDSLFVLVVNSTRPATLVLGARTPGAILFVDGEPQGPINGLQRVSVSSGRKVQLSIRAEGCVAWDSTVMALAGDSVRVGIRNPKCAP